MNYLHVTVKRHVTFFFSERQKLTVQMLLKLLAAKVTAFIKKL